MKTILRNRAACRQARESGRRSAGNWSLHWLTASALLATTSAALAAIPEPDNVVFGQIVVGTNLVTAQRTNVTVEVQSATGALRSSYPMGQNPAFGNLYVVAIPFWSAGGTPSGDSPSAGDEVVLLVRETFRVQDQVHTTVHYQTNYVVRERGRVERIDFGDFGPVNSGFDAWASGHGLPAGSGGLDADGDGSSNLHEYLAGTDPTDPNSHFFLHIDRSSQEVGVSFFAHRAEGTGYTDLHRYYSLESVTDLGANTWTNLPGFEEVLGDNQTVIFTVPPTNSSPAFYRGRVELRGP